MKVGAKYQIWLLIQKFFCVCKAQFAQQCVAAETCEITRFHSVLGYWTPLCQFYYYFLCLILTFAFFTQFTVTGFKSIVLLLCFGDHVVMWITHRCETEFASSAKIIGVPINRYICMFTIISHCDYVLNYYVMWN